MALNSAGLVSMAAVKWAGSKFMPSAEQRICMWQFRLQVEAD